MELKPQGLRETFESLLSFNRTFMELKHCISVESCHRLCSFNRTFMELKLWKRRILLSRSMF